MVGDAHWSIAACDLSPSLPVNNLDRAFSSSLNTRPRKFPCRICIEPLAIFESNVTKSAVAVPEIEFDVAKSFVPYCFLNFD